MIRLKNKLTIWRENLWYRLPNGFDGYNKALDIGDGPHRVVLTLDNIRAGYKQEPCAIFHSLHMGAQGPASRWRRWL